MKKIIILATICSLISCKTNKESITEGENGISFYVGTYTGQNSQGIYKYKLLEDGSLDSIKLAVETPNPSFLSKSSDNKYLVAISEVSAQDELGFVKSYLIEEDSLVFISEKSSGGAHPCFVSLNPEGYVLVANYTGGNVALLKLKEDGSLTDPLDIKQHTGNGITDRQRGPHAHSAWFDPASDKVIAVDLGTNELWISHLDKEKNKLIPADPPTLRMNPGAGPRHLTIHPNNKWIYVVNELDCSVSKVNRLDDNSFSLESSISTLPSDFESYNTCADIHISKDGKFLYASNRGHNSIAIFSVNDINGSLKLIGHQSSRGETPRNFSLSPDDAFLLVANQKSNNIVSFKRNAESGLLEFLDEISVPSPVCLLF